MGKLAEDKIVDLRIARIKYIHKNILLEIKKALYLNPFILNLTNDITSLKMKINKKHCCIQI